MEKKNNGGLIVIIVVLLAALLGLSFYVAYDKGLIFNIEKAGNKTENNSEDNQDSVEEIALDDARFVDIYNNLKDYTYLQSRVNGYFDFLDSEKTIIGFKNSDIEKSDITYASSASLEVNAEVLVKTLQRFFGTHIIINHNLAVNNHFQVDYDVYEALGVPVCGGTITGYKQDSNTYHVFLPGGCGGFTPPSANLNLRKIVSAKKNANTIVVEEKVIYIDEKDDNSNYTYKVYSDLNKTNLITTLTFDFSTLTNETIDVNDYLENASTITHTYKLDEKTGNYYFVSSVIK